MEDLLITTLLDRAINGRQRVQAVHRKLHSSRKFHVLETQKQQNKWSVPFWLSIQKEHPNK